MAASEHSLRMFPINKKIVFTEKRYRVKLSSIKKHLLLIKQKQKKSKNTKTYLNETMLENLDVLTYF